jgi:hypothetical protein
MRKGLMIVVTGILAVSVVVLAGCSKGYETKRSAGDLSVTLKAARYPLIKGDNALSVIIADPSGKTVDDATVTARYYMPPMPGMAPMEYQATVRAKSGRYDLSANIPMEGGWRVDVTAAQPGISPTTATFNVDAR